MRREPSARWVAVVLGALLAAPAGAGGFLIFEQGARAMGMAGAFAAQADDPSALFHNVGGLAFFEEREVAVGLTLVNSTDERFVGEPPGIAAGRTGKLESLHEPLPHVYWVQPVGGGWNFGLAINSPFGLSTTWENPGAFIGRFVNTEASMVTVDLNPNLGVRLTPNLGIGFGPVLRFSKVELNRNLPFFDPFLGRLIDIGEVRLESDFDEGLGWQVGLLHKLEGFSWGLAYRGGLTIDYSGTARFTAFPVILPGLVDLVDVPIPFDEDLPVETEIEFPAMVTLGVAFGIGDSTILEADVNWTGWSSFDALPFAFPGHPELDLVRPERWKDVMAYRIGARLGRGEDREWRFGVLVDESPQPDASVSPLLPDLDRIGYAAGWGRRGDRLDLDLAVLYLDFEARSTNGRSIDGVNGTYSQTGWLLAATLAF